MNLLNYNEVENFNKNNENLKYLNDTSGNLLLGPSIYTQ